jgi:hypothetical protein
MGSGSMHYERAALLSGVTRIKCAQGGNLVRITLPESRAIQSLGDVEVGQRRSVTFPYR